MPFFVTFIIFGGFHISNYEKNLRGWVMHYDCLDIEWPKTKLLKNIYSNKNTKL